MKGRNLYFSIVFSKLLDEWLKGDISDTNGMTRKRTQVDFANRVGLHPNMITRYKKGEAYPQDEERMQWIADAFGVDLNIFTPSTPAEKIAFDEEYRLSAMKDTLDTEIEIVKSHGIHIGFWSFFTSIKNIYDLFPFEQIDDWTGVVGGKYNSKGEKVGFTSKDLIFVKHLQDEVETTVTVLLIKSLMGK